MATARKVYSPSSSPQIFVAPAGVKFITLRSRARTTSLALAPADQLAQILRADGSIAAWGSAGTGGGTIGDGQTASRSSPVLVAGTTAFKRLWLGPDMAVNRCVFGSDANGVIYAWGGQNSTNGDAGVNSALIVSSPTLVAAPTKAVRVWNFTGGAASVSSVPCGFYQDASGSVYGWGTNWNGSSSSIVSSPTVIAGLKFTQIFGHPGTGYGFGLTSTGAAYAWGVNARGQLGVGNTSTQATPQALSGSPSFAVIFPPCSQPLGVLPEFTGTQAMGIPASQQTVYGITPGGILYAWGQNTNGSLGIGVPAGTTASVSSPVLLIGFNAPVLAVFNMNPTFAIDANSTLLGWGQNGNYQLGTGDTTDRSSPVIVAAGTKFTRVIANQNEGSILALDTLGNLWGWGQNQNGVLLTTGGVARSTPTLLVAAGTYVAYQFSLDQDVVYALDSQGQIWAWGYNANGQLGVGDVNPRSSATLVVGGKTWGRMAAAATGAAMAVDSNGEVWAWGLNTKGFLGDGTTAAKSSPVLVVGALPVPQAFQREGVATVSVVPGTSYPVVVGYQGSFFGGSLVGEGAPPGYGDLIVEYDQ